MNNTQLFYINNISVRNTLYYNNIQILQNTLTIITGKSGAGKSTLLQILNGTQEIDEPYTKERIFYCGKNLEEINPLQLRKEIILIPQKIYLYPVSIKENFITYYNLLDKPYPTDENIKNTLKDLGINKDLNTLCTELSGGERHRVYLALCFLLEPPVLLLDEPTAALDKENAQRLMHILRKKKQKQSIIMVCHDESLLDYADTILHLGN